MAADGIGPLSRVLDTIDGVLGSIEAMTIVGFAAVALVLGTMQVILRYAFNTGFVTSEALFVLATAACMMFAGSRAVREDKHVRFELMGMILPARTASVLHVIADGVSLALCAWFAWCGLLFVQFVSDMDTVSAETGLSDWIVYSVVPVTMAIYALRYVIRIIRAFQGRA